MSNLFNEICSYFHVQAALQSAAVTGEGDRQTTQKCPFTLDTLLFGVLCECRVDQRITEIRFSLFRNVSKT